MLNFGASKPRVKGGRAMDPRLVCLQVGMSRGWVCPGGGCCPEGGPPPTMGYGGGASEWYASTGMHSGFNIFEEVICWFLES